MLTACICAMALGVTAQESGPVVNGQTVDTLMGRVDPVFAKVGKLDAYSHKAMGDRDVSRTEIVGLMHDVFEHYKSDVRSTPRPFRIIQPYLDRNMGETKTQLREMIEWGMVPPAGPLVTGGASLTAEEFGDALGYFYLQLRRVTYQPDPEWTAELAG